MVYVLEGELTLIEDGGETVLSAGDCAAFAKGSGDGHHLINRSGAMAVYLEVGARSPADVGAEADIVLTCLPSAEALDDVVPAASIVDAGMKQ